VQLALRDPVQLLIEEREELLGGCRIAGFRALDESADRRFHPTTPRPDAV
jgi:hypothetical protein